jgi:hypothetical protein
VLPVAPASADRVATLVEQLGAAEFAVREQAEKDLEHLGIQAYDAIEAATLHPDLEVAARARRLLRAIRWIWLSDEIPADIQAGMKDYETIPEAARRERVLLLAALPDRDSVEVLCRIVRFDKSLPVAKLAAAELMRQSPPAEPPDLETAAIVEKTLGAVRRAPANWLRTWLVFRKDPKAALAAWMPMAEEERVAARKSVAANGREPVTSLLLVQLDWLNKLERREESLATVHALLDIGPRDPPRLFTLAREFTRRKAWAALAAVGGEKSRRTPGWLALQYLAARGHLNLGDKDKAEAALREVRGAFPVSTEEQLKNRYDLVSILQEIGFLDWAEFEARYIIDASAKSTEKGSRGGVSAYRAKRLLGELYHGQDRNLEAAELCRQAAVDESRFAGLLGRSATPNRKSMLSHSHLYAAYHWQSQKDAAKQRKALEDAVAADPTNPDALIACHRLSGADAAFRAANQDRIRAAAAELRQQLGFDPNSGVPPPYGSGSQTAVLCNNLAWLLANTDGDCDEALRLARAAVRASPQAGYLDTLAHVHYTRREWDSAVKHQSRAVELSPDARQMRRQLEVFKKAAEDARRKPPPAVPRTQK